MPAIAASELSESHVGTQIAIGTEPSDPHGVLAAVELDEKGNVRLLLKDGDSENEVEVPPYLTVTYKD